MIRKHKLPKSTTLMLDEIKRLRQVNAELVATLTLIYNSPWPSSCPIAWAEKIGGAIKLAKGRS